MLSSGVLWGMWILSHTSLEPFISILLSADQLSSGLDKSSYFLYKYLLHTLEACLGSLRMKQYCGNLKKKKYQGFHQIFDWICSKMICFHVKSREWPLGFLFYIIHNMHTQYPLHKRGYVQCLLPHPISLTLIIQLPLFINSSLDFILFYFLHGSSKLALSSTKRV